MKIIESYVTKNPCYKAGKSLRPLGLMLHSVGCAQPSAEAFVKAFNNENYSAACVHAFIDGYTGDVHQTLPWNTRGWHAGGSANNTHIGVEMCEAPPSALHYDSKGTSFEIRDASAVRAIVTRTYNSAVELFAELCKRFGLDPLGSGVILSHKEGSVRGIASYHGDPEHLWSKFGPTMDKFRQDVAEKMRQPEKQQEAKEMSGEEIYKKLSEYMNAQPLPEWFKEEYQKEYQEAIDLGITDGTNPMGLIPRYQAALMARRAVLATGKSAEDGGK